MTAVLVNGNIIGVTKAFYQGKEFLTKLFHEQSQSMSINLSKKDVVWGYFAQFFSLATGLITLPLILNMLSTEEIAMNYLMITIGSLVSLFDFGFAPQFGRNITYIFSGAQELKKKELKYLLHQMKSIIGF